MLPKQTSNITSNIPGCLRLFICTSFYFGVLFLPERGGDFNDAMLPCQQFAPAKIKIAVALAQAFNCGVNDLPLSLILSWYEQKACAILLTLLHLGLKDIRLGQACLRSSLRRC